jgi:hypothetical protein
MLILGLMAAIAGGVALSSPASPPDGETLLEVDEPQRFEELEDLETLLPGPRLAGWAGLRVGEQQPGHDDAIPSGTLRALAWYYKTDVYTAISSRPRVVGHLRRGTRLEVTGSVRGNGCKGGRWYQLVGGGYGCTAKGFTVKSTPQEFTMRQLPPRLDLPFQHRYGKVMRDGAPRLFRIPTPTEEQQIAAAGEEGDLPDVVDALMKGVFIVALDRVESEGGRRYWRTIRGRYIRESDVELYPRSQMHGELLAGAQDLPLAFVYGDDAPVFCRADRGLKVCGVARKHARFPVRGKLKIAGLELVAGPDGLLLDRHVLRVVRAIPRPEGFPAGEKWVHVDVSQQTLVAYEGDRPVFATLVSGGKQGYEAPIDSYRVVKKYVSITMSGEDPTDGWYEVEEVPWTLYYWEGYALHGAYWHNDFGRPRSHGCTNLPPADARWLFYWTDPKVPWRWHGYSRTGTRLYFSSDANGNTDAETATATGGHTSG